MMESAIQLAMKFTLAAEGKFTIDDGGPTMYGVTQRVYDAFRLNQDLHTQSVEHITMAEVETIMRTQYWNPAACDLLETKLAICQFDWAYNHGVRGANQTLQMVAGVAQDGIIGQITLRAIRSAPDIVTKQLAARLAWYRDDAQHEPSHRQYLAGWINRVNELKHYLATLGE